MVWENAAQERRFRRFDLNLIYALDVLLEERNVTHAASRLCVTQPAMSAALQRMRDFFGDQLLVRVGREMELTPRAKSLITPIRDLLLMARGTLDTQPSFDPQATRRSFRIAMSDYSAFELMPRIMSRLSVEAPYLALHVENLTGGSIGKLPHNDLDFSVTSDDWRLYGGMTPGPDIRVSPLFSDHFVCVADRNNACLQQDFTVADYESAKHAVVRIARDVSSIIDRAWTVADLSPRVAVTAPSFSNLLLMLPGTQLVATTPSRMASLMWRCLPLRQLPCPILIPDVHEVLVWHTRNEFDPGHSFVRGVIEWAAQTIDCADAGLERDHTLGFID